MTIRLHPHAAGRMAERGATPEEVEATVAAGNASGTVRAYRVPAQLRHQRYLAQEALPNQQIEAYAVEESSGWLVITVIVKYF